MARRKKDLNDLNTYIPSALIKRFNSIVERFEAQKAKEGTGKVTLYEDPFTFDDIETIELVNGKILIDGDEYNYSGYFSFCTDDPTSVDFYEQRFKDDLNEIAANVRLTERMWKMSVEEIDKEAEVFANTGCIAEATEAESEEENTIEGINPVEDENEDAAIDPNEENQANQTEETEDNNPLNNEDMKTQEIAIAQVEEVKEVANEVAETVETVETVEEIETVEAEEVTTDDNNSLTLANADNAQQAVTSVLAYNGTTGRRIASSKDIYKIKAAETKEAEMIFNSPFALKNFINKNRDLFLKDCGKKLIDLFPFREGTKLELSDLFHGIETVNGIEKPFVANLKKLNMEAFKESLPDLKGLDETAALALVRQKLEDTYGVYNLHFINNHLYYATPAKYTVRGFVRAYNDKLTVVKNALREEEKAQREAEKQAKQAKKQAEKAAKEAKKAEKAAKKAEKEKADRQAKIDAMVINLAQKEEYKDLPVGKLFEIAASKVA